MTTAFGWRCSTAISSISITSPAQVRRDHPVHDPAAEHTEDDRQVAARGKRPRCIRGAMHPGCRRCSSVEYAQYAPSSRPVNRAPRPSRCNAGFHHWLLWHIRDQSTIHLFGSTVPTR